MIDPFVANVPQRRPIVLNQLLQFNRSQIVLSDQEAWCVLAYFFDHPGVHADDLTENDLSFAQALVIEAIEQSYGYGFLYPNQPIYLAEQIKKIVITVLKKTGGNWNWTAALPALLKRPDIHIDVRTKLSQNHIWNWIARVKTKVPAYSGIPAP